MVSRSVSGGRLVGITLGACALCVATQVFAIEEIVVTTQKRAQKLEDVPLAVSAFDAKLIEEANVQDFRGLVTLTPGLNGGTDDGFTDALNIRGISTNDFGIGGDPSVPVFVDGVWEGRNGGAVSSFMDIQRAEVVRGPQNTLFGRNAIAGAISMTTNPPSDKFEANLSADVEQYRHYEIQGTVNVPLSEAFSFRASALRFDEDGYLQNLAGGPELGAHTRNAVQAALRFKNTMFDATLRAFYESRTSDPSVYWSTFPLAADGSLDPNGSGLPRDRVSSDLNAAGEGKDKSHILRLTLNAEADLRGGYTVTSITGFKTYDFFYREDYDATAQPTNNYQQDQTVDYFSQEFRLNSPPGEKIVWFTGASFYSEKVDATFDNIYSEDALCRALVKTEVGVANDPAAFTWAPGTTVTGCSDPTFELVWGSAIDPATILANKSERSMNKGDYAGWAVYADGTWSATDRLDLTLGGRYTYDRKKFSTSVLDSMGALGNNFVWSVFTDGFVTDTATWSHFNPRLAVNFRATDAWAFYANVGTGYKAGGFSTFGLNLPFPVDPGTLVPPGTTPKKFNPEKVLNFEVGTRARLLDNTLQINLSVYHYIYDDLQLTFFQNGSQLTGNVAKANGTGVELDGRFAPNPLWDAVFSVAHSTTRIDSVDQAFIDAGGCDNCKGNELWLNPAWSSNEIVTRHFPLANGAEVFVQAEHHYQDSMFAGPDNLALAVTPSYSEFNFRLGYDSGDHWTGVFYVQNAFNRQYFERGWENADADNHFGYGLVNSLVWPSKPRTFGVKVGYKF